MPVFQHQQQQHQMEQRQAPSVDSEENEEGEPQKEQVTAQILQHWGGGEDDDNASWRTTGNKYLGHPASIKTIEVVVHGTVCWCCACVSVCVWGGGYRR